MTSSPPPRGTVLIVEDVHWADEATLDVLRFLARRIDDLPAVLVLTYRDELDRDHPLSRLLGDLGHGDRVERIALRHLSSDAVGALTAGSGLDADRVYAMTEGNPYFVSELVASADADGVPPTVVDAVTGRLRRLDPATQDHVEQLAVRALGGRRDLLARLVPGSAGALRSRGGGRGCWTSAPRRPVPSRADPTRGRRRAARVPPHRARAPCARRAARVGRRRPGDGSCTTRSRRATSTRSSSGRRAPRATPRHPARTGRRPRTSWRRSAHADRYDAAERAESARGVTRSRRTRSGRGATSVESRRSEAVAAAAAARPDRTALGASLRWLSRFQWFGGRSTGAEERLRARRPQCSPTVGRPRDCSRWH